MRAVSSVTSVTIHVAVGAVLLLGTTRAGKSNQPVSREVPIVLPEAPRNHAGHEPGLGILTPDIPAPPLPAIPLPSIMLQTGAPNRPAAPAFVSWSGNPESGQADAWRAVLGEAGPEVLSGPLPTYPELLRRAGVEGLVVLEAVVDSTGRVQPGSIAVVSATNPGFVEPARRALRATLFRPARVAGRAVAMLVRVPFAFAIRDGTGRAR